MISKLLESVEKELLQKGARVVMHETFDTERVDFLSRNGYEIYGILVDYPLDLKAYYMKKILI